MRKFVLSIIVILTLHSKPHDAIRILINISNAVTWQSISLCQVSEFATVVSGDAAARAKPRYGVRLNQDGKDFIVRQTIQSIVALPHSLFKRRKLKVNTFEGVSIGNAYSFSQVIYPGSLIVNSDNRGFLRPLVVHIPFQCLASQMIDPWSDAIELVLPIAIAQCCGGHFAIAHYLDWR